MNNDTAIKMIVFLVVAGLLLLVIIGIFAVVTILKNTKSNPKEKITWTLEDSGKIIDGPVFHGVIMEKMDAMRRQESEFIILRPSSPVAGCFFMQTCYRGGMQYEVEVSIMENGENEYGTLYYRDDLSFGDAVAMFTAYLYQHQLPDDVAEWKPVEFMDQSDDDEFWKLTLDDKAVYISDISETLFEQLALLRDIGNDSLILRLTPVFPVADCTAMAVRYQKDTETFSISIAIEKEEGAEYRYGKTVPSLIDIYLMFKTFYEEETLPEDIGNWSELDFQEEEEES